MAVRAHCGDKPEADESLPQADGFGTNQNIPRENVCRGKFSHAFYISRAGGFARRNGLQNSTAYRRPRYESVNSTWKRLSS